MDAKGVHIISMRGLALVTDAFGGNGGIALYNRDFLTALCSHPACSEIIAIPRLMPRKPEPYPEGLKFVTDGLGGKIAYVRSVFRTAKDKKPFNFIVCGHLNLLPIAMLLRLLLRIPVILVIYGIEAWKSRGNVLSDLLVRSSDIVISISEITKDRFVGWSHLPEERVMLLPNAVHLENYGIGQKKDNLIERYGLENKTVIMTLGRLSAEERYKGFDELIEILPRLIKEVPTLRYLIVGDGNDRQRLLEKSRTLGVSDKIIFTGFIPESEKADHYRLADVFAMPGRGEGFGFVFLEAMACGVPVVASKADGSREAVKNGELGIIVDPDNPEEIKAAILKALKQSRGTVPEGLDYFSFANFQQRLHRIIDATICN